MDNDNNTTPEIVIEPESKWKPLAKKILLWGGVIAGTALITILFVKNGSSGEGSCELEMPEDVLGGEIAA